MKTEPAGPGSEPVRVFAPASLRPAGDLYPRGPSGADSPRHHQVGEIGEFPPAPPGIEHLQLVGAEQQAERPPGRFGTKGGEGVDRPAGSVAGEFAIVHVDPGMPADCGRQHGPPLGAGRVRRGPVHRNAGWHQGHRVQSEPAAGLLREPQVTGVDGIEGAAQNAENARRARRVSLRAGSNRAAERVLRAPSPASGFRPAPNAGASGTRAVLVPA